MRDSSVKKNNDCSPRCSFCSSLCTTAESVVFSATRREIVCCLFSSSARELASCAGDNGTSSKFDRNSDTDSLRNGLGTCFLRQFLRVNERDFKGYDGMIPATHNSPNSLVSPASDAGGENTGLGGLDNAAAERGDATLELAPAPPFRF
jgi:hypothetical protein